MAIAEVKARGGGRVELPLDTSDDKDSDYVWIDAGHTYVNVLVPDLTNAANVSCQLSEHGTLAWFPVLDPVDGTLLIVCASGSDPGFYDLSDVLRGFTGYVHFYTDVSQTVAVTFVLRMVD